MNRKLIFFKGVYDTLDLYTEKFIEIFQTLGDETLLIDTRDMTDGLARLAGYIKTPVTAAIMFNNLGFNMELVPGKNIWDELHIRCINILMDHPFHYDEALKNAPRDAVILCMDRKHMDYVRRFYPNIAHVDFLPHAGMELPGGHKPLREREIDVLYAGGLSSYVAQNLIPDMSSFEGFNAEELSREVLHQLITHPAMTTEDAIEAYLHANNIQMSEEELCKNISRLRFVDSLAVSHFREQAVKLIAQQGVQVTIYGVGWEKCPWTQSKNVTLGGRVAASEILQIMKNTKVVLNTMTWFKDGTHDRVFNGMLAGALVVSDDSGYMRERFTSGRELELFSLSDMAAMPERVSYLLTHEEEAQKIADCGYLCAHNKDLWINRVQDILLRWMEKDGGSQNEA